MNTYDAVKSRLLRLLEEKRFSIHKLAIESAVPPSTIKNILYGKSQNPGVTTIKLLCDGLGISLIEFFNTPEFENLEQEIQCPLHFSLLPKKSPTDGRGFFVTVVLWWLFRCCRWRTSIPLCRCRWLSYPFRSRSSCRCYR